MKTVTVKAQFSYPDGKPVKGVVVEVKLSHADVGADGVYQAVIARHFAGNDAGLVEMDLWPNELGSTSSRYKFKALSTVDGRALLSVEGAIPDSDCWLHEVVDLPDYPGRSYGELAIEAAIASVAPVLAARDQVKRLSAALPMREIELVPEALAVGRQVLANQDAMALAHEGAVRSEDNAHGYAQVSLVGAANSQRWSRLAANESKAALDYAADAAAAVDEVRNSALLPMMAMAGSMFVTQAMLLRQDQGCNDPCGYKRCGGC